MIEAIKSFVETKQNSNGKYIFLDILNNVFFKPCIDASGDRSALKPNCEVGIILFCSRNAVILENNNFSRPFENTGNTYIGL